MFGERPPSDLPRVYRIDEDHWQATFGEQQQLQATLALEAGGLILLPRLAFRVSDAEQRTLSPDAVRPGSKHVSFDLRTGRVRGATLQSEPAETLRRALQRYAEQSLALVRALLPRYAAVLEVARTSFRPVEASGRVSSWRKDDRRLHVDAFPSSPSQGRRLLRVFSNVDPDGGQRVWNIGEPFDVVAGRFLASIRRPWPGQARILHALRITRGLRSEYDHIMLGLHDRMKADGRYQENAASTQLRFPAGSTWIVQTDAVSHAALSGRYMFEQTFLVPVDGMLDPDRSPLRILESLAGRRLA
jgi:3-deoxy-D-manno-oct-2-ulosonic acid (Kdo) hydroxylase